MMKTQRIKRSRPSTTRDCLVPYGSIRKCDAQCTANIANFWSTQDRVLEEAVAPYLWVPATSASVEQPMTLTRRTDDEATPVLFWCTQKLGTMGKPKCVAHMCFMTA